MLDKARAKLAKWIRPAGRVMQQRDYASARGGGGSWRSLTTSADTELASSLTRLRNRSRELMRDAAHARRIKRIVVNNVIGSGVGMQARVKDAAGEFLQDLNTSIEQAFTRWKRAEYCHTGGELAFHALERLLMAEVVEAGEILVRLHFREFGGSGIPLALEVIEPERLADTYSSAQYLPEGGRYRMGIERDDFGRPVAYWIREHMPGLQGSQANRVERVPASSILHLRKIDRWPQSRGAPLLHATARKLDDADGYTEAEIRAARGAASYMGVIETNVPDDYEHGRTKTEDGQGIMELAPGMVDKLQPGEKWNFVNPNRPNSNAEGFLRWLAREMAAGADVSYESMTRDYSQSNYSSSRLGALDDRDNWRVDQSWWIETFRMPLHRVWLRQASLANAIAGLSPDVYALNVDELEQAVMFKPRGWTWIDPAKEVKALKDAVRSGFTTVSQVIAQTNSGMDFDETMDERERELKVMDDKNLAFDTTVIEGPTEPAMPPDVDQVVNDAIDNAVDEGRIVQIGGR